MSARVTLSLYRQIINSDVPSVLMFDQCILMEKFQEFKDIGSKRIFLSHYCSFATNATTFATLKNLAGLIEYFMPFSYCVLTIECRSVRFIRISYLIVSVN